MTAHVGDDLIWGLEAIAAECSMTRDQADTHIRAGRLPVGRIGRRLVASRATLRRFFTQVCSGGALGERADEAA
jgi:hypothetical protein